MQSSLQEVNQSMRQHLYITSHILRYPFSSTGSKFPSQATCKRGLTEKIGSVLIDGTNKISISIPSKRTKIIFNLNRSIPTIRTSKFARSMLIGEQQCDGSSQFFPSHLYSCKWQAQQLYFFWALGMSRACSLLLVSPKTNYI